MCFLDAVSKQPSKQMHNSTISYSTHNIFLMNEVGNIQKINNKTIKPQEQYVKTIILTNKFLKICLFIL